MSYDNRGGYPHGKGNGGYGNKGNSYNQSDERAGLTQDVIIKEFSKQWITDGADEDMIKFAEKCGKYMAPTGKGDQDALTNSQIRNVFGEIKRIQAGTYEKNKAAFLLLRPKMAYNAGRGIKNNGQMKYGIQLFKKVFDAAAVEVKSESDYQNFVNLMEAILAYHKAFGGND